MPALDGIASILVGLLLISVSLILARESRSLLMGEGITGETRSEIKGIIEKDDAVKKTINILSTYQSPDEILLILIISFRDHLETSEINTAIERIRQKIRDRFSLVKFVIIQPEDEQSGTRIANLV